MYFANGCMPVTVTDRGLNEKYDKQKIFQKNKATLYSRPSFVLLWLCIVSTQPLPNSVTIVDK